MKTIALIPARLESERFPNKLIKKLGGVPIIVRTYLAALNSKPVSYTHPSPRDAHESRMPSSA